MMRTLLALISLALVIGGCQTTVGDGPIVFSDRVAALYQHYQSREYPLRFAVSENGRWARYTYCPWNYGTHCVNSTDTEIISLCQEKSGGVPCRMFARGNQVIWKNPGNFLQNHVQGEVRLDGTEPVLFGDSIDAFKTFKAGEKTGTHRAFAVNYRLSTKELIASGFSVRRATREEAISRAMAECRRNSNGRETQNCKLYMVDEEKVWFTDN